ncbi:AraC family transcriptional regulator [Microcoleus sp. POL10_C6]|uniref:AraC family transcriptional regulator n=1 Tax=Microcoleus sp. POL10_C6 TaxID=2818852 RepID=UPI002FD404F1
MPVPKSIPEIASHWQSTIKSETPTEYINEHLNQDIKLADLAQLLGMSQFHFSHLLKQFIGTSP